MASIEHDELEKRFRSEGEATPASALRKLAKHAGALESSCILHILAQIAILVGEIMQAFVLSRSLRVGFGQP